MRYEISGSPLPVAICYLANGESLKTERGAMSWMSPNMAMSTNAGGGIGKMFSRAFSGESIFQNTYTAQNGEGMIAFASSFPGNILALQVTPNQSIIAQKSAFLASENGVEMSMHFQKKFGAGFFGGEGFIMQKFSGNGIVFLEIDGSVVEYNLAPGESMIIDTGNLAVMDETVRIDIESVKGLGNMIAGGEGFFNTRVTGPGKIYLQSMPVSAVAGAISPFLPKSN